MTIKQYQDISKLDATDNIEFIGNVICILFNKTPQQVDNMPKLMQLYYAYKAAKALQLKYQCNPDFITDATKITLGQFIEVNAWIKDEEPNYYHLVAASIYRKRNDHKTDAAFLLHKRVVKEVQLFLISFASLVKKYDGLFEPDDDDDKKIKTQSHPFIVNYGWLFTAKSIADYLGITVNEAYKINIIEALNTMVYLKSFNEYQEWQTKQST